MRRKVVTERRERREKEEKKTNKSQLFFKMSGHQVSERIGIRFSISDMKFCAFHGQQPVYSRLGNSHVDMYLNRSVFGSGHCPVAIGAAVVSDPMGYSTSHIGENLLTQRYFGCPIHSFIIAVLSLCKDPSERRPHESVRQDGEQRMGNVENWSSRES